MVARVGCKLVPNNGPARIVDQRRLLARMELTLVRYLAGVNWVREQCIEMTAREGFAAAFGAIRRCPGFRPKPETVGLLLDPAHAAELTIKSEDAADGLGLGRIDDECARRRHSPAGRFRPSTSPSSSRRRSCRGCVHR